MGKQNWKPGNMLNPVPAVMVSVTDKAGNNNIITVAWAGTVCTNPPMLSISVRPERFSYNMIKETGEFVVNLTTEELLRACDYCGVKSGSAHERPAAVLEHRAALRAHLERLVPVVLVFLQLLAREKGVLGA